MHWLFQLYNAYNGTMKQEKDEDGEEIIYLGLPKLGLMKSWYEEYCRYMEKLPDRNHIYDSEENFKEAINKYSATKSEFCDWMDCYPEMEPNKQRLEEQRKVDAKSRERYLTIDLIEQLEEYIAITEE